MERSEPEVNYLAKDYASFRQLILDRLALLVPDWTERHVPDIGIALVELLAYAGDYLSYYQDAVATEAYLETARQRISVRRHARLVDSQLHEGANARTWITLKIEGSPLEFDAREMYFITRPKDASDNFGPALTPVDLQNLSQDSYEVYEPLGSDKIRLFESHNEIHFYTWSDDECCLDRGATSATLIGRLVKEDNPDECPPHDQKEVPRHHEPERNPVNAQYQQSGHDDVVAKYGQKKRQSANYEHEPQSDLKTDQNDDDDSKQEPQGSEPPELHLRPGDFLIFEEVIGPKTGNPADANGGQRHVVRLTHVRAAEDPLNKQPLVEIEWAAEDALPFPVCLSVLGPPWERKIPGQPEPSPPCQIIRDVSLARGNVVLVDHGRTTQEDLGPVPVAETIIVASVRRCRPTRY